MHGPRSSLLARHIDFLPPTNRIGYSGMHGYKTVRGNIPTLKSHMFSKRGTLLWDNLSEVAIEYPAWWDHRLFAGGIATLLFLTKNSVKLPNIKN